MSFTWFICFHKYLNGDCTYLVECLKVVAGINLVRNSLEHGTESVIINQSKTKIEIINSMSPHNSSGFGLGLMLVERLAKQLNWNYYLIRDNNQFRATLFVKY
ncbi:hypothetical protein L2748_21470, partial [Shewanella sairae]